MDKLNNRLRTGSTPFYPLMLPLGRMINLASIQTVDWLEADHRVALRGSNDVILAMIPASSFGGEWTDDPIKICRTIRQMLMDFHRGESVDTPNWFDDDEDL